MLDFLDSSGLSAGLPLATDGSLQVSSPFCGRASELPLLIAWLERHRSAWGARQMHILGTDIQQSETWQHRMQAVRQGHPGLELDLHVADLSVEQLPAASLVIGLHPEISMDRLKGNGASADRPSLWQRIVTSVLSAAKQQRGLCVLACYYKFETRTVMGMCGDDVHRCQVFENPYWHGKHVDETRDMPFMRYLIIINFGSAGTAVSGHQALQMTPLSPRVPLS
jgi:hypothetical protein